MAKRLTKSIVWKGTAAFLLTAVVVSAISGCAAQAALALEAEDNGREITLQKGQILTITLPGNPSTGYSWMMVDPEASILRQVGEPEFKADSELVGAPGTLTLRFEAVEAGQTDLTLGYQRPWETGVEPPETFTAQVIVK
jgi:inhibitor of cysteine peptidase